MVCVSILASNFMTASGKLVGIDLGTTFSAIATLDDRGQAVTLPNIEGEMLTPSRRIMLEDGAAVVGQAAPTSPSSNPAFGRPNFKRYMGHPKYPPSGCQPRFSARNPIGDHS